MTVYYNEHDPFAAAWLRALIAEGHLAAGTVDERDIRDVEPDDLVGYTQCHFFAGIGGWSRALRLAGWPDERPVWTGSCPCQPFSAAGKRGGFADERHLWPAWHWLIQQQRPGVVFGEQVASADGLQWFDLVSADLEGTGYTVGAADLCAAGVGAPHIRQRLWFVAHGNHARLEVGTRLTGIHGGARCTAEGKATVGSGAARQLGDAPGGGFGIAGRAPGDDGQRIESGAAGGVEHAPNPRCDDPGQHGGGSSSQAPRPEQRGAIGGFWSAADWLPCTDGKARPVEPGTFPLAHGVRGRMAVVLPAEQTATKTQETHWYSRTGALRGFGNAIVPEAAAEFIAAYRAVTEAGGLTP